MSSPISSEATAVQSTDAPPKSPWRIGVDVGGTFTDVALVDENGALHVAKVPSSPGDPSKGVLEGVERLAVQLTITAEGLLAGCSHFMHASTVATNIVLERSQPAVGMIVTRGFRDSLEIRRGIRQNAWDHRTPFPPPLAPRFLRLPVGGRLDRQGHEIEPLSREDVSEAVRKFRDEGVTSIAICLFNSFVSDRHEREVAALVKAEYPEAWLTLSSEVAPIMGEYERGSTAVLNAYVSPKLVAYVKRLAQTLSTRGLRSPFYVVQNNAGAITAERVAHRAVALLLSGPAAGIGALELYGRALGEPNLLSMEIGGTSCDVTLFTEGRAETTAEFELGGYHVALPTIDIHSIGAGGGTIAAVDHAGMLSVGPRGAGSEPGPAAYGLGGEEPTITDAQLVLGRLMPGPLAGGARNLNIEKARRAVSEHIAKPLGLSLEAAASGMLRLLDQQLLHAVQKISAERGHDPRKFILVAAGGAGPMHSASVARKLGLSGVYVPRLAGAFCALGMLNLPIKHEFARVFLAKLADGIWPTLDPLFAEFETEANARLAADGFASADTRIVRELELRHPGQIGTLRVALSGDAAPEIGQVREDFLAAHERLYGHRDLTSEIEIAGLRVTGLGLFTPIELQGSRTNAQSSAEPCERMVYFDETAGAVPTRVFEGASLAPGTAIEGPAIVEESTTSVVIGPDDVCTVDALGNYFIRFNCEVRA